MDAVTAQNLASHVQLLWQYSLVHLVKYCRGQCYQLQTEAKFSGFSGWLNEFITNDVVIFKIFKRMDLHWDLKHRLQILVVFMGLFSLVLNETLWRRVAPLNLPSSIPHVTYHTTIKNVHKNQTRPPTLVHRGCVNLYLVEFRLLDSSDEFHTNCWKTSDFSCHPRGPVYNLSAWRQVAIQYVAVISNHIEWKQYLQICWRARVFSSFPHRIWETLQ